MNDKKITTLEWLERCLSRMERNAETKLDNAERCRDEAKSIIAMRDTDQEAYDAWRRDEERKFKESPIMYEGDVVSLYENNIRLSKELTRVAAKVREIIESSDHELVELTDEIYEDLKSVYEIPFDPVGDALQKAEKKKKESLSAWFTFSILALGIYFLGASGVGWVLIGLAAFVTIAFFWMFISATSGGAINGIMLLPAIIFFVIGLALVGVDAVVALFE